MSRGQTAAVCLDTGSGRKDPKRRDALRFQLRARRIGPIEVEKLTPGLVDTFVGVRAEEVALRLREVLRELRGAVAVEVGERG